MISPDAYIWARVPPTYVEEAQYESIHHAIRSMRDHAKASDNSDAKIEVVLQAYDWNPKGLLQPSHINMHQQVNYILQPGWVDRGVYGIRPQWEPPPDGIWFWWWHDCKSKKQTPQGDIIEINRWDEGTKGGGQKPSKPNFRSANDLCKFVVLNAGRESSISSVT